MLVYQNACQLQGNLSCSFAEGHTFAINLKNTQLRYSIEYIFSTNPDKQPAQVISSELRFLIWSISF